MKGVQFVGMCESNFRAIAPTTNIAFFFKNKAIKSRRHNVRHLKKKKSEIIGHKYLIRLYYWAAIRHCKK